MAYQSLTDSLVAGGLTSTVGPTMTGSVTDSVVSSALQSSASGSKPSGNAASSSVYGGSGFFTYTDKIEQTERLLTTRSRNNNYGVGEHGEFLGGGDRGSRAYIKLRSFRTTEEVLGRSSNLFSSKTSTSLGTSNSGIVADMTNPTNAKYNGYANFLVTSVNCSMSEKVQVTEVFGDSEVVYYFGRSPITFSISGMLTDSIDNNWFVEWLEAYGYHLRGTQLAKNYELVELVLPNMILTGSITGMGWNQESSNDVLIPFSFQMLVREIEPIKAEVGIIIEDVALLNFQGLDKSTLTQLEQNNLKANAFLADLQQSLQDPLLTMTSLSNVLAGPGIFGSTELNPAASALSKAIDGITASINLGGIGSLLPSGLAGTSSLFNNVAKSLSGVRTSLFAPVYGVLSSLTKLVQVATGSMSIVSTFTNSIRNIVRDINAITGQVKGLVDVVNNLSTLTQRDISSAINSLRNTLGSIGTVPTSAGAGLAFAVTSGTLPATSLAFLNTPPITTINPSLFMNAGVPAAAASLALTNVAPTPTIVLLAGINNPSLIAPGATL